MRPLLIPLLHMSGLENQGYHVYISLESTVSKMKVEIMVKWKNELLLKLS